MYKIGTCKLSEFRESTPKKIIFKCYRNPSTLFFGDHLISSSVRAQQGDPCGPMIFSLAIQTIILSLDSQLNTYLVFR
jgi:hypothetical protein